jgi:hypothetical protein
MLLRVVDFSRNMLLRLSLFCTREEVFCSEMRCSLPEFIVIYFFPYAALQFISADACLCFLLSKKEQAHLGLMLMADIKCSVAPSHLFTHQRNAFLWVHLTSL